LSFVLDSQLNFFSYFYIIFQLIKLMKTQEQFILMIFLLLLYGFKIKIVELLGWRFTNNFLCIQSFMLDDDAQNNGTHESIQFVLWLLWCMTSCNSCTHMIFLELQILCNNYYFWATLCEILILFACILSPTSNLLLLHGSWWFTNKFEVIISNFKCNIQFCCFSFQSLYLFFFFFDIMNILLFWLFMFTTNSTSPMSLQIKKLRFKTMHDDQISQTTNSHIFFINNKFSISPSSNVNV
jgi:hypothetical protein